MLPGFGVAGVLGLAAVAAADGAGDDRRGAAHGGDVAQALAILGASLVITAAVVYAWLRHLPNSDRFGAASSCAGGMHAVRRATSRRRPAGGSGGAGRRGGHRSPARRHRADRG